MNDLLFLESGRFNTWLRKNRLASAVAKLREQLVENPEAGAVIPGYGNLRKVRMAGQGRGKRSGFRVVYVLLVGRRVVVLIDGYSKSEKEDLSDEELERLLALARETEPLAEQLVRSLTQEG